MQLIVENAYTRIVGASISTVKLIDKWTSYPVPNAHWAKRHAKGYWDGKTHLLRYSKVVGYRFPTGVLRDICTLFENRGIEFDVMDARKMPKKGEKLPWMFEHELRPYQKAAVRAICEYPEMPVLAGRGLIRSAPRSGKTVMAASVIRRKRVRRAMFLTSKTDIHVQTLAAYRNIFGEDNVDYIQGQHIGDARVVVAMAQTLISLKKRDPDAFHRVVRRYGLVVFDEAHHLKAATYRDLVLSFDCPFKIGLSGTIYISRKRETEARAIWLAAATGPIRYSISIKKLVGLGYLVPVDCVFVKIVKPDMAGVPWAKKVRKRGITHNAYRNRVVVEIAKRSIASGRRCIIIANEHEHIVELCDRLDRGTYRIMFGDIATEQRAMYIREFERGNVSLLVGNVISEGVDLPNCQDVVNASGGASREALIQKLRNMTAVVGKGTAIYYDFMDDMQKHLRKHSLARIDHMRREGAFSIEEVDVDFILSR